MLLRAWTLGAVAATAASAPASAWSRQLDAVAAPCVVVMGVAGCGKSSIGQGLALALGLPFVEGDALHPPRNVALMASGTPLTDSDRAEWLQAVAGVLRRALSAGQGVVVSCSALKRSYRDVLREAAPALRLVHPHGPAELLARRLRDRVGHYMPASLLASQLQTLEAPAPDEASITLDITQPVQTLVARASEQLQAHNP